MLETIEVQTGPNPAGSVIWLHGLGADGHDFEPIVPQLALDGGPALRFVFPHAPVRPVTLNNGMAMRAWFDIFSLDKSGPVDESGIRQSAAGVEQLIARELERGISLDRITLAGFSQGGVIATFVALRYPVSLAGLMALSTYLPMPVSLASEISPVAKKLPILLAHGDYDPVLPISLGQNLHAALVSENLLVDWRTYPMEHAVCPQEIHDIRDFLQRVYG